MVSVDHFLVKLSWAVAIKEISSANKNIGAIRFIVGIFETQT